MKLAKCLLLAGIAAMTFSSLAQAQYYERERPRYNRTSRDLICQVMPPYRQQLRACAVAPYGWSPGDYCECRLESYGRLVPGTIQFR